MTFYTEGIEVAKRAVAADARATGDKTAARNELFRVAKVLYEKSVEYFVKGLEFDKEETRRRRMTETATTYIVVRRLCCRRSRFARARRPRRPLARPLPPTPPTPPRSAPRRSASSWARWRAASPLAAAAARRLPRAAPRVPTLTARAPS